MTSYFRKGPFLSSVWSIYRVKILFWKWFLDKNLDSHCLFYKWRIHPTLIMLEQVEFIEVSFWVSMG
jgi:hypothetical protein